MTWLVSKSGNQTHVTPIDDLRDHATSADCWCKPDQDGEYDSLFLHNSADKREDYETGRRKHQ